MLCICNIPMKSFVVIIIDIDECDAGTDGCDQICVNRIGTYECECNGGYALGEGCTGK